MNGVSAPLWGHKIRYEINKASAHGVDRS
jgi:hypothetical protein